MESESLTRQEAQQKKLQDKFKAQLGRVAEKLEAEYAELKSTTDKLQKENTALKESLDKLTGDYAERLQGIESKQSVLLEEKLSDLRINLEELRTTLYESLPHTLIEENVQVKSVKQSLESIQAANIKVEDKVLGQEGEVRKLTEKADLLERELQEKIKSREKMLSDTSATQTAITSGEETSQYLDKEKERLKAEIESKNALIVKTDGSNTVNKVKLRELQKKLSLLTSELNRKEKAHQALLDSLDLAETQFKKSQDLKDKLSSSIDKCQSEVAEHESQLKQLAAELKEKEAREQELINESVAHEKSLKSDQSQQHALVSSISKLQDKIKSHQVQLAKLAPDLVEKESHYNKLTREAALAEQALAEKKGAAGKLEVQLDSLKENIGSYEERELEYQDKLSSLKTSQARHQDEEEKLTRTTTALEDDIKTVQEKERVMLGKLGQFKTELPQQEKQIQDVVNKLKSLQEEIVVKNELSQKAQDTLSQKEAELNTYHQKMAAFAGDLEARQSLLQEMSKTLESYEVGFQNKITETLVLLKAMAKLCLEFDQKAETLKKAEEAINQLKEKRQQWTKLVQQSKAVKLTTSSTIESITKSLQKER